MPDAGIDTLFWDVGGVLLTNGWDRHARRRATDRFELDYTELDERHRLVIDDFETGRVGLDEYLVQTVFYHERPFSREAFREFMFTQSQALPDTPELALALARTGRYGMFALNNESFELNEYRIRTFSLDRTFSAFFSSCHLGMRKPASAIYRMALRLVQRAPERCVFIDDRPINLESAARLGLHTVHSQGPAELREALERLGVTC